MAIALLLVPAVALAGHLPLIRDPQAYLILGMRRVNVFSLAMEPPGCNIGVNCAPLVGVRGGCGFFHSKNATFPEPSQIVANQVCGTRSFYQVFANLPTCTDPKCSAIADPGPTIDCTSLFDPPIIGDLDGDGIPSCDTNCMVDLDDVAAICGVTLPFPSCDLSRPVSVWPNRDCSIADTMPGNGRCDLAPGVYGALRVRKGGRIDFSEGTTVLCSLNARTATRVTAAGPATVLLPGAGWARFGNSADVGGDCGLLRIVSERGAIKLGRFGDYSVDACTLAGRLRLGHGNNLRGHLVGDVISSDISNEGRCCETTTTTSTTTTSTTSTSTTTTSTTSTTSTSTTTTSTTAPTTTTSTTTTSTSSTTVTTSPFTIPTTTTTSTTAATSTSTTTVTTTSTTMVTTSSSTSSSTAPPTTTSSTTTTTTRRATTTTRPNLFTRTPGFYKTHPAVTKMILADAGGLTVCGRLITDVHVNHGHSAIEALCIKVQGNQRAQLLRHLLTAALTMAAGGATYSDFAACDAVCRDPNATTMQLSGCINTTDAFNNSGDNLPATFGPSPADPGPCEAAFDTACTVLDPSPCAVP